MDNNRVITEKYVDLAIAIVNLCVYDFTISKSKCAEKTLREELEDNKILTILGIDIDNFIEKVARRKEFIELMGGLRNYNEYKKEWYSDDTRRW